MEEKTTKTTKVAKTMNIYQKLVEVQKAVRGLGKDAKAQTYDYVSGSKVLSIIRPKMDELGLLLVQEVNDIVNERVDYQTRNGAKSEMHSKVMMTFRWIDSATGESLAVPFGANGCNGWDKGLGSALTYAERYFLLKFFHIATDEDDIDARPIEDAQPIRTIPHDEMYWNFVKASAESRLTPKGKTARESFISKFKPTQAQLEEFDNAVTDYKVANAIK